MTLILLAIFIQIMATILIISHFSDYYWYVKVVSYVLTGIVLLSISLRDMQSEGKLPWVIEICLFPITGVILYLCFSRNYVTRRQRKLFAQLPQTKFADNNPVAPSQFLGQIRYLKELGAPSFTDSETKYFNCGEVFWEDLLKELEKAQKFVFLEYFIVERGKMFDSVLEILKRKVSEGVEVRILYDDVGSLLHTRRSFIKKINKLGIKCAKFGKVRPIVSAVYNNRDHRKICVIDGTCGYIGGINLADEYINYTHPFGYWKDTAVRVRGKAVSSMCLMFLQMYDMAVLESESFDKYIDEPFAERETTEDEQDGENEQPVAPLVPVDITASNAPESQKLGVVIPFGDGPKPIYNEYVARNVYLNMINQAEHDLYVTTPYLIVDEDFSAAIISAAKRGVNVNIIIPAIPDKKFIYAMTKYSCIKLIKNGVKIYKFTDGFIHAKSIVADGAVGVVGSTNLDYRSFVHHYECGVFMYATPAIGELYDDLVLTSRRCELLESPPKLKLWERFVCVLTSFFRPLV